MKKLTLLLFLPLFSIAQSSSKQFIINGSVKGLPDSTLVAFVRPGEANEIIATSYAKGGKFTLFGQLESPDIYQVLMMGKQEPLDLFTGNETITITGSAENIASLNVVGSVFHKDYQVYQSRFNPLKNNISALAEKINKTAAGPERDALIPKYQAAIQQVLKQVDNFIKERPASPVSAFVIYVTSGLERSIEPVERRYASLKPSAKKGTYATELEKSIASTKIGSVGTQAIDFTQNDTANIPVKLSSFKGKYVLVDFWASWCGPCRMENPAVVAAYNQYKDKNFTILGVSLDQVKDKWLQAIKADNLTWTHVSDLKYWQNQVAQLYRIQGIPANMLIDPSGKIIARDLRGEVLQAKLREVLK